MVLSVCAETVTLPGEGLYCAMWLCLSVEEEYVVEADLCGRQRYTNQHFKLLGHFSIARSEFIAQTDLTE